MNVHGTKRVSKQNLILLFTILFVSLLAALSVASTQAQSEDGVIVIDGIFDEGFVTMEWDYFVPAPRAGDPYCIRHQAYADSVYFKFVLDLGQGSFTGSSSGKTQADELGWKATGSFQVTGISGTIYRVEDDGFGDWEFQGSGEASLDFWAEAWCLGEDAQGRPQNVLADRAESITVPVQVDGRLGVINETWTWRLNITSGTGEARFRMTCYDCEVGTWTASDEFSVNLDCQPTTPLEEEPVVCAARVLNVEVDEDLEYMWYVDSAKEADTRAPTWTWASAEKGTHDITVYVQGEGRDTESTVTIEVGEERELVASIGLDPPIPVVEKGVIFTPVVEGAKAGETLRYRWFVDGNLMCETAACTWGEAPKGGHFVQLEVRGEGERIAVGQREFDVVTLVDEETAGFRIVVLGCNSGVSSDETLACSLGLERDEGIGLLNVTWLIDGVVASTDGGVDSGSDMQLGQPAPGEHVVDALVVDPANGNAISGQTVAEVVAGQNALIPPLAQVGAAGGTLGLVGVWLWAEWMNAKRAEADEERLRALQKPSWVDDKRSLEEIWAADVEAERQRRGLWGFEYNKEKGIFKQPEWAWALTEEQRKELQAHGDKMPWWWVEPQVDWWKDLSGWEQGPQEEWDKQRQILRDPILRADRSLEGEWLGDVYAEPLAAERKRSGWIYKQETDAWEKASWHPDEIAKRIRAGVLKTDRAIDAILDKLPVSQWGTIEALQEKLMGAESPNAEDLLRMLRMRGAVYNQMQAQYELDKVAADVEAIGWQEWQVGAERMRAGATAAAVAIAFSPLILGGTGWALGATTLTKAGAAMTAAMAKMGAIRLTMNLVEGVTVGYMEGGTSGAVVGGMRRTLPINTMGLWLGPRMSGDKGPGWKRIGFSVLQDVGNAVTLKRGITEYSRLARRAGESISGAYQRLTSTGEQPLRMPPVRNSVLLKQDATWWAEREQGQKLVNDFNRTLRKMNQAADRFKRAGLSNELTKQAIKINENYAAKSIMKVIRRPGVTKAFDDRIQRIYKVVDHRVAKALNSEGFTRGGRDFSRNDLMNFRNASSYGTVGMDRDVGLNEMLVQKWEGVVNKATPGTDWHAHAAAKLRDAQRASQLGVGGQRISLSNFNDKAQKIYEKVYGQVTGGNARKSFQQLTTSKNVEAYADKSVLQNNPAATPFSRRWAEQTGSVSSVKVYENFNLAKEGIISQGSAMQESARGLAKDISTKLIPLLKNNPSTSVQQLSYWQGMQKLLGESGKGNVTPGQLMHILGIDQTGMVRLGEQVSAGIQSAVQYR